MNLFVVQSCLHDDIRNIGAWTSLEDLIRDVNQAVADGRITNLDHYFNIYRFPMNSVIADDDFYAEIAFEKGLVVLYRVADGPAEGSGA